MLLPTLLLLCALLSQMVYSHTPAGLRALANLHTQRSRAIANALNLRARTQYNTAIARARASNLGIYDHRFIRDSGQLLGDRINADFDADEQFPFHINGEGDDLEDFLIPQNFGNEIGDGTEDFTLQQRGAPQDTDEGFIERQQSEFNLNEGQPWKQQFKGSENQDNILQIPLNFDDLGDFHESPTNPIYEDGAATSLNDNVEDIINSETGATIFRPPQEVDYVADNSWIYSNPNEASQFSQEHDFTHTCSDQHIGTQGMETLPPEEEYQNSNSAEQTSTTQPLFITYPATLDQQGYLRNSDDRKFMDENGKEPHIRSQPNVAEPDLERYNGKKSADPTLHRHLRPHGHVFTHTHSYFHGATPLQPSIPTAQVVNPGINLNVIQNQNAAVNSQFAATAIHSGINSANVNPSPVLHGNTGYDTSYIGPSQSHGTSISQAQSTQAHSFPVMPNTHQFEHNLGGNAGHSSGVSQSQNIQSHSSQIMANTQQFPQDWRGNAGHSSGISQSQNIQSQSSPTMPNTQQFVHDLGSNAGHSSSVSQSQNIQSHSSSMMPNTQQFVQDLRGNNAGHSSGISQSQNIQTHSSPMMPNTQQYVPNLGGNAGHSSDISQSQNIQLHSSSAMPNTQFVPNFGGNSGHGSGISQSQSIQTHSAPVPLNTGSTTISQTQSIHQGARGREPVDETNIADDPTVSAPIMQMDNARGEISDADEQVGTFLTNAPMYVPEYHSDPSQPQNYQGVIKYIEGEQARIRQLLHIIEKDQYNHEHQFNNNEPVYLPNSEEQEQPFYNKPHTEYENMYDINRNARERLNKINLMKDFPGEPGHSRLDEIYDENEKVGTINMGQIELDPIPRNLEELEFNLRRHLEVEEQTVQEILDQIDQNYRTNMHTISSLIYPSHDTLHDPTHVQNYHDADSKENIHIQEVDIPDDKTEKPESPPQLDEEVNYSEEERMSSKMLKKAFGHDLGLQKTEEMNPDRDRLGYIIQIPERRYSDDNQRQARSLNETAVKLDQVLLEEKKVFNDLKKDAKHDEDLMMIGYIGDSLIADMENRVNKSRREKRQTGRIRDLPLHRLVTDPKANFDMSKTLGNLGAVTKNVFEHEKAPLYHVRNMVGAAQDAVLATMKIPTKNFLIPSAYDIVNTKDDNDKVGAINPRIFSRNGGENLMENGPINGIMNTFQRVGSAIRGSVLSGQEVLTHVGDVANHAKRAIYSTKNTAPRVVWKKIPAITREPKKIMLITPRIFDISGEDNQVGSTIGKTQADFVKVGHILDAVGVSNPNYNNVEFEKIVIEPRNSFSDSSDKPIIRRPSSFKNLLENIKIIKMKNADDEDFVGNALNSLNEARSRVGANSLKDFIVKMRHEFRDMLRNGQSGKNRYRNAKARKIYKKLKKLDENRTFPNISIENRFGKTQDIETLGGTNHQNFDNTKPRKQENHINNNMVDSDQETVGASFLPEVTRHPFLDRATATQRHQFMQENNYDDVGTSLYQNHRDKDRDLGQILGAINPLMFERIFNETLKVKNGNETPHSVFHHHHSGHSHGHHHIGDVSDEETVGTSMAVKGQITKPFMGYASNRRKQDFFSKYMPEDDKQQNEYEENLLEGDEYWPETPQWVDIFHPLHESSIEYDE